jgi:hypothetical protein
MKYMRVFALLIVACFVCSSAFGQVPDPIGFCPLGSSDCQSATGPAGETILVGTPGAFDMERSGAGTSATPWYLLIAIPNGTLTQAQAPVLTSGGSPNSFTPLPQTGTLVPGQFNAGNLFTFAGLNGSASMSFGNLAGADGTLFPPAPSFFEVFKFTFSPGITGKVFYPFGVSSLTNGTFLAGTDSVNANESTTFTTTGLIDTTPSAPDGGVTLMLLGSVLVGLETLRRRLTA